MRVRSVRQLPQATILTNTERPPDAGHVQHQETARQVRLPYAYNQVSRKRTGKFLVIASVTVAVIVLTPVISTAKVIQPSTTVREAVATSFRLSPYPDPSALPYETITIPVTRSKTVAYDYVQESGKAAQGTVRLFNESSRSVALPTGTRLVAPDGLVYLTDGPVTVPGKTRSAPGSIAVRVSASSIGITGNRDREDFDSVQSSNGKQIGSITGRTESGGLTGGIDLGGPVIAAETQAQLLDELRKELSQYVLPDNFVPKSFTTLSGGVSRGPERVSIGLDPETKGSAKVSISQDVTYVLLPVKELASQVLASLPQDQSTLAMVPAINSFQGLVARISGSLNTEGNQQLVLALQGTVPVSREYDHDELSRKLAGKPIGEARSIGRTLSVPVSVRIFPPWAWKLPSDSQKIKVSVGQTLD